MKPRRLLTLYVNRGDREVNIPSSLKGKPFVVALSPAYIAEGTLSQTGVDQINEALGWGCELGQRGGMSDRCDQPHELSDPWHSKFACPYHKSLDTEEKERRDLLVGKRVLENKFDKSPLILNPINHLIGPGTEESARKEGFTYMVDRNQIGIYPYVSKGGMSIIPEAKAPNEARREGSAVYADLGSIQSPEVLWLLEKYDLVLPEDLEFSLSEAGAGVNTFVKNVRKKLRDAYQFPKRFARQLKTA